MLDTNVIIALIAFKSVKLKEMLKFICENHALVLSNKIIDETIETTKKKFPQYLQVTDKFFEKIPYEYFYLNDNEPTENYPIRDKEDVKILQSAILSDADVLITEDNDFFDFKYDGLEILKPVDFMKKYNK
jgi:putative PIN family toxin of toxin-antitoxin system